METLTRPTIVDDRTLTPSAAPLENGKIYVRPRARGPLFDAQDMAAGVAAVVMIWGPLLAGAIHGR